MNGHCAGDSIHFEWEGEQLCGKIVKIHKSGAGTFNAYMVNVGKKTYIVNSEIILLNVDLDNMVMM